MHVVHCLPLSHSSTSVHRCDAKTLCGGEWVEGTGYRHEMQIAICILYARERERKWLMVDKFPSWIQFWVLDSLQCPFSMRIHCNISHLCPFDYPSATLPHCNLIQYPYISHNLLSAAAIAAPCKWRVISWVKFRCFVNGEKNCSKIT
jgi:hypothetical protein